MIPSALYANLKHIKDDYRNPVSHPEVIITKETILEQKGAYFSVIEGMLREVAMKPKRP